MIDARLLTSYEVREDEREPVRRVEIIHQSLLANWPRLVRWQTPDRRGRSSGTSYGRVLAHGMSMAATMTACGPEPPFSSINFWRERYPGGLTESEEAFASAMTSLATGRRRRRRTAVASIRSPCSSRVSR